MKVAQPVASIVIPAHDEETVIGRCLAALAATPLASSIEVVVVANGCTDDTVGVASGYVDRLPGLVVVDEPTSGKVVALNRGDEAATAWPRIYLDADIELGPGALEGLVDRLAVPEAVVAAPRVRFDTAAASYVPRSFFEVFEQMPYASGNLVGLGVYGLSEAGRARWGEFPDVTADDLFVQQMFAADERVTTPGEFTVQVPRRAADLVRVRTRGVVGTQEISDLGLTPHDLADESASTARAMGGILRKQPWLAPALVIYVVVTMLARTRARTSTDRWLRDDSTRVADRSSSVGLRVAYLVTEYPAPSHVFVEREILGLRELGVDVTTFSVRSLGAERMLSQTMRDEAARTTVLLDDRPAVLASALRTSLRHPVAVARAFGQALGSGERTLRSRLWQLFYLAEALRLHALLSAEGLRHVHVHFANNSADVARLVVRIGEEIDGPSAGWRWTLAMHGPTEFEAIERFDLAAKVRSAHAVACISDFARSQLMRLVAPEHWDKLRIVRMSVDVERYRPPSTTRSHDGPTRLLYVGRLVPEKGAPVLLDAVSALVARGVDVELRVIGDGELRERLRRTVESLDLGGVVTLVGAVGQDEMPDHFAWADVFCLPSFQEGLPVVLMEAMASGLPVVTTAIAGIPELVEDGRTGRVVAAGRADLVADAIAELAADSRKRSRWGRAGRTRVVDEFATTVTAPTLVEFFAAPA